MKIQKYLKFRLENLYHKNASQYPTNIQSVPLLPSKMVQNFLIKDEKNVKENF